MQKRQDIEFLRIISALAIVWFHSGAPGGEVSYAGLIVFLVLSMYLAGRSPAAAGERMRQRFRRLLVPWIFWWVVYGALNLLAGRPLIPLSRSVVAGILSGPSIHLWYMPFIFTCLTALDFAKLHMPPKAIGLASAALAVTILATTPAWRAGSMALGYPFAQYAHASAGVFIGIFLLYFDLLSEWVGALLLTAVFLVAAQMIGYAGIGIPYMIAVAVGCLLAYRALARTATPDLGWLSQCTLGIYFLHILVLGVLARHVVAGGALLPLTAFALSAAMVLLLRRAFPHLAKYWS